MRVELNQVSRRFGTFVALRSITAAIPSGRRVALIGPNGAGKSTMIRIIMGMLECEGEVMLEGLAARESRQALAHRIAYVPQVAPAIASPVRDVAGLVTRLRGLAPEAVAQVAARLELDLETISRRPVRALSGGMRQKLMLALAFAGNVDLLILDEPTGGLDAASRQSFLRLYEELPDKASVILCSHRLDEIESLVDHAMMLEGGELKFDGPTAELLARRSFSMVEVSTGDPGEAQWLRGLGFSPGAAGAWARMVRRDEKLDLLCTVACRLRGDAHNLVVRDLDQIEA